MKHCFKCQDKNETLFQKFKISLFFKYKNYPEINIPNFLWQAKYKKAGFDKPAFLFKYKLNLLFHI